MSFKTNGKLLSGLPIAVDYWVLPKYNDEWRDYVYFLSHMHTDHTSGLTSTWPKTLYTSKLNAELAAHMLKVPESAIIGLELNAPTLIELPRRKGENETEMFQVTLLDANHIAGSVMFLFQGTFGNILYTADFRYSRQMLSSPSLKPLIVEQGIDRLYVDNTYFDKSCNFPTRKEATKQVINLVRKFPDHRIIFGCHTIGKEDVLVRVALELREKVFVPQWILDIYSLIRLPDIFTTNPLESRFWYEHINKLPAHRKTMKSKPTIIIALTALPVTGRLRTLSRMDNVFFIPYSNHSSYAELEEFLSKVNAKKVHHIVDSASLIGQNKNSENFLPKSRKRPSDNCTQPARPEKRTCTNTDSDLRKTCIKALEKEADRLNAFLKQPGKSANDPEFCKMLRSFLRKLEPITGVQCPEKPD